MGTCRRRHDKFFKDMYEQDPNKSYYKRKYLPELLELLDSMINKVDERIRKSITRIEAPMPDSYNKLLEDAFDNRPLELKEEQLE